MSKGEHLPISEKEIAIIKPPHEVFVSVKLPAVDATAALYYRLCCLTVAHLPESQVRPWDEVPPEIQQQYTQRIEQFYGVLLEAFEEQEA